MKDTKNFNWLLKQPREYQISMFGEYSEMLKILANELMAEEIEEKCGKKYQRDHRYSRWGSNPGSIKLGEEKFPIEVPRYYDKENNIKQNVDSYKEIKEQQGITEAMIRSILLGLSQKDYREVVKTVSDSFGLSQSTISRRFLEKSSAALEKYESRDLGKYDFVGLMLDGKWLAKEQIVISMGITIEGDKLLLGFIQTTSENNQGGKRVFEELT